MPTGFGFWYDRLKKRYWKITDHAQDAILYPNKFRAQNIVHLDPIRNRDEIIRFVARQGFIRIRLIKDHLGFQFHGNPESALKTLKRLARRHSLGPAIQVTFTDFECNITNDLQLFQLLGENHV